MADFDWVMIDEKKAKSALEFSLQTMKKFTNTFRRSTTDLFLTRFMLVEHAVMLQIRLRVRHILFRSGAHMQTK